jgi:hypothetical protein
MTCVIRTGGGLGNLMFEYCALYSFSKKRNLDMGALVETGHPVERPGFFHYSQLFRNVKKITNPDTTNYYEQKVFTYSPIPDNATYIYGNFQSWKYFIGYETEIRDTLRLNDAETFEKCKTEYETMADGKKTICCHIRRGDLLYNSPEFLPLVHEDYYAKALARYSEDYKILVFSDNIEMVNYWNVWKTRDVVFVKGNVYDPVSAFFTMSMCNHFIIANSTLSLTAYYLREHLDAELTAPMRWFGVDGPVFKILDIVPENAFLL